MLNINIAHFTNMCLKHSSHVETGSTWSLAPDNHKIQIRRAACYNACFHALFGHGALWSRQLIKGRQNTWPYTWIHRLKREKCITKSCMSLATRHMDNQYAVILLYHLKHNNHACVYSLIHVHLDDWVGKTKNEMKIGYMLKSRCWLIVICSWIRRHWSCCICFWFTVKKQFKRVKCSWIWLHWVYFMILMN